MKNSINKDAIHRIAEALKLAKLNFNQAQFEKDCFEGLEQLELKQRVHHIIEKLEHILPKDFIVASKFLFKIKKNWNYGNSSDRLQSFAAWPLVDYMGVHGLGQPKISLDLLADLTSLFSAEFAIRFFIQEHFDLTLSRLLQWSKSNDEHLRRLASEGCRPRLPWGIRLKNLCDNPKPIIPILVNLKQDPSAYVRRSVANNLNDMSKDHPELVIEICKKWGKLSDNKNLRNVKRLSKETSWIIKHATRSLVKSGHKDVFTLLGYTANAKVSISNINLNTTKLELGGSLIFDFSIQSLAKTQQYLVIDYAIHHVKANAKTTKKVFKLKTLELDKGDHLRITKKHSFKKISTRKYYSGKHTIEIIVNGLPYNKCHFELNVV